MRLRRTGAWAIVATLIAAAIAGGRVGGAGFPDASNTGVPAGTTLTPQPGDGDGNYVIATTNAVVNAVDAVNCFVVNAAGVTIRNSQARCVLMNATAENPANAPLTIEDSEIDCDQSAGQNPTNSGIWGQNLIARRLDITDCENGFYVGDNFTIVDNYVHNLYNAVAGDPHTDAVQVYDPGGDNGTIRHNTLYAFSDGCVYPGGQACNGTSAIIYNNVPAASALDAPVANVVIENNLLAGGSVALYCVRQAASNFSVTDNRFSTIYSPNVGESGLSTDCNDGGGETQSGNVIHETGAPVTLG